MKLDIAELRRLAEAATPSPWTVRETVINGTCYGAHWVESGCVDGIQITGSGGATSFTDRVFDRQPHDDNEANARFVAAWRNAALDLLDRLASAEAALREIEAHQFQLAHLWCNMDNAKLAREHFEAHIRPEKST